ncbi:O-antigen ligase family protein [Svornostia abyssi]|uniref:O-antigen ligase family protein n=1 Tax=Svornostia abyssi TaxID=2898438 RepID=A0ABY5PFT6_9ACTN|nr:O-antigen ligase family protein [Parviterribacteraceae bacterium J379]
MTPALAPRSATLAAAAVALAVSVGLLAMAAAGAIAPRHFLITCGVAGAAGFIAIATGTRPAWLISAGVVLSTVAGHWELVGLPPLVTPERILLVGGVLATLLRVPAVRDVPHLRLRPSHWALMVFAAFAAASALAAGALGDPIEQLDRIGLPAFACFLAAPVAFATVQDRKILLGCLTALGAYLGVLAVVEIIASGLVFPAYIADPGVSRHLGRARGPFLESEVNGFAMFACLVAAMLLRRGTVVGWQRRAAEIVVTLCVVGIVLTLTRAAWAGAAAGAVAAAAASPQLRRVALPLAAAALVVVIAVFAVIPTLTDRASERATNQETVWDRQNLNRAAVNMFLDAPLTGKGWNSFQTVGDDYFWLADTYPLNTVRARTGMHNLVLARLAEVGLIGAGLWLLASALALLDGLLGPPRGSDLDAWRVGLLALVTCHVVLIMVTPAAHPFQFVLLFTWAGIAAGPKVLAGLPARTGEAAA